MNGFSLQDIPYGYFSQAVYLDPQFIIAAPEMPITDGLLRSISEWGFSEVFSDGEPGESYSAPDAAPSPYKDAPARDGAGRDGAARDGFGKDKDKDKDKAASRSPAGDLEKIQQAEAFYASFQRYVKNLFTLLPVKNELDFNVVAEQLKPVCDYVRENRRFLLRTKWLTEPVQEENQMVSHATRSTVIAIIISTALKLQNYRLIEVAVAALLHEVGMIKLPQENYTSKRTLTEQERKLLYAHPILGYNILKSFDFPLVICVAALEHHERENGTGYPQRKTGDKISLYAKIIAIACSYEAILSSRPHKDAKDGHSGIMELLKNEGKQYDDTVVRALVYAMSIYPIGLNVLLSNDKKGQVVDINPENPRYPIVEVFGELTPNGKNKIMRTSQNTFYIVRPLTPEEIKGP